VSLDTSGGAAGDAKRPRPADMAAAGGPQKRAQSVSTGMALHTAPRCLI
jgi:hypothetical protein